MVWLYLEEMEFLFYLFNEEKFIVLMDLKFKNCEFVLIFVLFLLIVLYIIKSNNVINFNFKYLKL